MAEKPQRAGREGDGIAQWSRFVRQEPAARGEQAGIEALELIEKVVRRENMLAAQKRVVQNRGAPGVDGVTVDSLMDHAKKHWTRIRGELLSGTYQPQPVKRVEIPKPDGRGTRMLGIPTVMDRLIQQALLQVLTPLFDPTFSDGSFGFRPGRGTHDAVRRAHAHITAGFRWCVDMDLEKFFDRVNHDVLMARVARRVKDKRVLLLIRRYLQAGLMEGGVVSPRSEGTPQGGPLSPLLSNILLDELDKELERRGHRFVRYADDCNVYVKSKAAGERVMASLEKFLTERLRLKINREKSAVARPWDRKFLGYSVTSWRRSPKLRISDQAIARLRTKLRPIWRRGRGSSLVDTIRTLNPIVRGWTQYFKLASASVVLATLDEWLRRRLRCILWRQWKRPRTRAKELIRRGIAPAEAWRIVYRGSPWVSSGRQLMNIAIPNDELSRLGLVGFLDVYQR